MGDLVLNLEKIFIIGILLILTAFFMPMLLNSLDLLVSPLQELLYGLSIIFITLTIAAVIKFGVFDK